MFREGIDEKEINEKEVIPFYDQNEEVEEFIYKFLQSAPPESKATIMTLFEPTGTGKTTICRNLPIIYKNVYRISIPKERIQVKIVNRGDAAWHDIIAMAETAVSHLNEQNKSVSLGDIPIDVSQESDIFSLSLTVREKLGQEALVFLHIDEFQLICSKKLLTTLYSLCPCSKNVKMIVSGTTALGNDKIQGMSEFNSIACPPLNSFGLDRVHLVLTKILYWEELKIEGKNEDECKKIKTEIEMALTGTPKCILFFLQSLYKSNATQSMKEEEIYKILDMAYKKYSEKQKKMLEQLLDIGEEYSTIEQTNLFEKIVLIFTFPEDFGLERREDGLIGDCNNEVIKFLTPFNHSGLVRIYRKYDSIFLSIPDSFTKRYIQEHTLYFPKEWLNIFNSTCDVSSALAGNVKGYSIQILLAILLLNQHSLLSLKICEIVKERQELDICCIYYGENVAKNTYSTFESLPEEITITGPSIAKDGKKNSCVDVIIPFTVRRLHKKNNSLHDNIPFFIQITCQKDNIATKAKLFFERIAHYANSKSNTSKKTLYTSCVAIFISVYSIGTGKAAQSVTNYLNNNSDFILLELQEENVLPNLDLEKTTHNIKYLQEWIKNSASIVNITNSGKNSPISRNWEDKFLSPYGSDRKTKKQKYSNVRSSQQHVQAYQQSANIGSSQMHSFQSSDLFLPNLGSSQVHSQQAPTLQRATGEFKVGDVTLDKSGEWIVEDIKKVLTTSRKEGGVGLSEKRIANVDIEGSDFENIVDALISFNGDKEAKIEHACKEIECQISVSNSIVRWAFVNLLEYK